MFFLPILAFLLFCRLHGSYEAIEGGQTMDALVDLTGGLAERHEIKGVDPSIYKLILSANKAGSFIACSRKVSMCTLNVLFLNCMRAYRSAVLPRDVY